MEKEVQKLRLTDYLQQFWDNARGDKVFPSIDCIRETEIDESLVDDVFILLIHHQSNNHYFSTTYIGNNILKLHADPLDTENKEKSTNNFLESYKKHFDRIVTSRRPMTHNIEIHQGINQVLKYRQILLPIGNSADKPINAILGGMRYKRDAN
ncbi:MAG: hypothetical protein COV35_02340 [Alphaproteobacteria bacterium CG11_big_fil_rev_8_21_14_0_20_39_49]|nr:MAG: hypothetical protein COV35_02340 [Alphaproteobacteria bacterium CG11_big_fil_rev_8_21_14_0_20_39_49]